jgi:transposase
MAAENQMPLPGSGFTIPQLARRWRKGEDTIRNWIKRGELSAINTADRLCGRPQYRVTPEAVAEFELRRQAATSATKPKRRKRLNVKNYFD